MEYLDGETLAERLQRGPLGQPEALKIGVQICDALDAAHSVGYHPSRPEAWQHHAAFGAVLYEMLTGKRAFSGDSQASLIPAILNTEPPLPQDPLGEVLKRCIAKYPADRWQSIRDVSAFLWPARWRLACVGERRRPAADRCGSRRTSWCTGHGGRQATRHTCGDCEVRNIEQRSVRAEVMIRAAVARSI
jgi:serine/threonine protein kinase